MPASMSRARERMFHRELAIALEAECLTENPLACVYRFNLPELPERPVLRDVALPPGAGG